MGASEATVRAKGILLKQFDFHVPSGWNSDRRWPIDSKEFAKNDLNDAAAYVWKKQLGV